MTDKIVQKASIGRIVHYKLSEADAAEVNRRRIPLDAKSPGANMGFQYHVGNEVAAGDVVPAIITRVWSDFLVNLTVMLDGNDTLWATSRTLVDDSSATGGTWDWPPRV